MKGKVEQLSKSKSGKAWRVLINGKYYGANFDSKIDSALNRFIDYEFDDGKYGLWIQTWGLDTQPPPIAPASTAQSTPANGRADRWWAPFTSNICAHAVAAGIIKEPIQLRAWAMAAKNAIEAADGDAGF